jgi:hypothetical protein
VIDPAHVTEFFNALCAERGGIDRLSITESAIAKALAQCLATEPIDAALIASLTTQLPPVRRGKVGAITVRFVKPEPSVVEMRLHERIAELERELEQARSCCTVQQLADASSAGFEADSKPSNVVPMKPQAVPKPEHADAYATLASLNAGFRSSPYIPVDSSDARDYGPRK